VKLYLLRHRGLARRRCWTVGGRSSVRDSRWREYLFFVIEKDGKIVLWFEGRNCVLFNVQVKGGGGMGFSV
jgi:hypothetical protein